MKKKSKFTKFDIVDYLNTEELIRLFIAEMRTDGSEMEIQSAEEVGKRACARHGLSLAAAGLTEEGATNPRPASPSPIPDPKKRTSPQPEPMTVG